MAEPLTADELAEYRQICDGATPGPWTVIGRGGKIWPGYDIDGPEEAYAQGAFALYDDAAFCAAARTALPACLDEIKRLQSELAESRESGLRYRAALTLIADIAIDNDGYESSADLAGLVLELRQVALKVLGVNNDKQQ